MSFESRREILIPFRDFEQCRLFDTRRKKNQFWIYLNLAINETKHAFKGYGWRPKARIVIGNRTNTFMRKTICIEQTESKIVFIPMKYVRKVRREDIQNYDDTMSMTILFCDVGFSVGKRISTFLFFFFIELLKVEVLSIEVSALQFQISNI